MELRSVRSYRSLVLTLAVVGVLALCTGCGDDDDFQANRAPDRRYRTAPLKGLWAHTKGGFFHDGRFPALAAVVDHYNSFFGLGLTASQKSDLVEYLKSL